MPQATFTQNCKQYGAPSDGSPFSSEDCREVYNEDVMQPLFEKAGVTKLAQLRAEEKDSVHGGDARQRRGRANAQRALERAAWEAANRDGEAEKQRFKQGILPSLSTTPLSRLQAVTGLSIRYCSLIRRGLLVPHPVHHEALGWLVRKGKE